MQLNTAGIEGINDPGKLLILKREEGTSEWAPLATSRDSSGALISGTLSSFSEFTVGGNAETNPLPVKDKGAMAEKVTLRGNTPNPVRQGTTIRYALPQAARVTLTVYDVLGRQIATLASEKKSAGRHAATFDASDLPAGVYLYRLRAGSYVETRRMVVVR
ncbi:MAG: hypothetical protein BRD45_05460 [Bacteroidetes bacterium QS_8_64_10]|nr:MAG: hypothetical protein BRD45_05460 [Bacteroidetes bacterium QS_8_64_10]